MRRTCRRSSGPRPRSRALPHWRGGASTPPHPGARRRTCRTPGRTVQSSRYGPPPRPPSATRSARARAAPPPEFRGHRRARRHGRRVLRRLRRLHSPGGRGARALVARHARQARAPVRQGGGDAEARPHLLLRLRPGREVARCAGPPAFGEDELRPHLPRCRQARAAAPAVRSRGPRSVRPLLGRAGWAAPRRNRRPLRHAGSTDAPVRPHPGGARAATPGAAPDVRGGRRGGGRRGGEGVEPQGRPLPPLPVPRRRSRAQVPGGCAVRLRPGRRPARPGAALAARPGCPLPSRGRPALLRPVRGGARACALRRRRRRVGARLPGFHIGLRCSRRKPANRPPSSCWYSERVGYADERPALLARLRQHAQGRALQDALRLDGRALRFHLGTSLADLRVPVSVSSDLRRAFTAAVRDLYFLLCLRHRPVLKEDEFDQLLLQDGFDSKALRPVSFSPPASVARDNIRRAFIDAPELHPALDAGLLASWIASGRPGRVWVGALNALLRRSMAEAAASDRHEPTTYLVLLSLRVLADEAHGILRKVPLGQPMQRVFHGAVATGLLIAARLAAGEAGAFDAPGGVRCEAATQALSWMGGLRHFTGSSTHAYGVAFADPVLRLDLYAQKVMQGASAEQLARDVKAEMTDAEAAVGGAERAFALAAVRADLLHLLRLSETARTPALGLEGVSPAQLFGAPGALERVLASPERRKEMQARAKATAKATTHEEARAALQSLARVSKEWREDGPSVFAAEDVRDGTARAVSALAVDAVLEKLLDQAELSLLHRSGQESADGIDAEYERGRLYRIGAEERPLLRARATSLQMGHLFCDVKDFTRRTALLKEAVVADFLSREFYTPILTAAARHHHGADHLHDMGGIYLNNLLGDAVSFSGEVSALVALAHDIRRALQSYGRRLENESATGTVSRSIAAAEERSAARRSELQRQIERAQAALHEGLPDESGEEPRVRLARLRLELARLEEERESEIALAAGEKLEAGIFISYGAAPEVATFEDHVFGSMKVAIAEKINESARGTARNGGVRARIDSLVEQERASQGRSGLSCPFAVCVSQPLSIPVPAEAE